MDNVFFSKEVILLIMLGVTALSGVAAYLFFGAVNGFLEKRKKVYEIRGEADFTLGKKIKEVSRSIRETVEKINSGFVKNQRYAGIEKMLSQLNMEEQYTRQSFMLLEEVSVICVFVFMYILLNDAGLALLSSVFAFLLPQLVLKDAVAKKKYELLKIIPNALDIISAYIEGGLSLPAAVVKYASRTKNIFSAELTVAAKRMELGRGFSEVMVDMGKKIDTKDVTTVVNAFVQAERSGGSIKEIIQSQAEEIRKRHFMALKQKAHEAPVKLLIPMIFFIFPVIFIVLFGPVVLKLMAGF